MVYYCCHGDHCALSSTRHLPLTVFFLNLRVVGVGIDYIMLGIVDGLRIRCSDNVNCCW